MASELRQLHTQKDLIAISRASDYGRRSFCRTGRLRRRIDRWTAVGVLVMMLAALVIGLVATSPMRPASVVRTGIIPATPPPASHASLSRSEKVRTGSMQLRRPQRSPAPVKDRERATSGIRGNIPGRETILSFTPQGLTLTLAAPPPALGVDRRTVPDRTLITPGSAAVSTDRSVAMIFVGVNSEAELKRREVTAASIPPADLDPDENSRPPLSPALRYQDVWPGIDILYTVTDNRLRSIFVVKPGADPNQIRLAYRGATAVRRSEAGQLDVSTPVGFFAEEPPVAYQESRYLVRLARLRDGVSEAIPITDQEQVGRRVAVTAAYTLESSGDTWVWGIHVGAYDPNTPLIIDQVVRYPGTIRGSDTAVNPALTANHDE